MEGTERQQVVQHLRTRIEASASGFGRVSLIIEMPEHSFCVKARRITVTCRQKVGDSLYATSDEVVDDSCQRVPGTSRSTSRAGCVLCTQPPLNQLLSFWLRSFCIALHSTFLSPRPRTTTMSHVPFLVGLSQLPCRQT